MPGARSIDPAPDSNVGGPRGAGDIDPRRIGLRSGWGNLPPKERAEALQQIGEHLPAYYRDVLEEYFRQIAR